jgi:hypothetical protein
VQKVEAAVGENHTPACAFFTRGNFNEFILRNYFSHGNALRAFIILTRCRVA